MIELDIHGRSSLKLHHIVFDVNGTLAVDGVLLDGIEMTADLVVPDNL
jgi:soluble P-type ATPase